MSEISAKKISHNLIIENRESVTLSGVTSVGSFDEHSVVLYSDCGEINISGSDLHMSRLSVDSGDVDVTGHIKSVVYSDNGPRKEGVFKKIFK